MNDCSFRPKEVDRRLVRTKLSNVTRKDEIYITRVLVDGCKETVLLLTTELRRKFGPVDRDKEYKFTEICPNCNCDSVYNASVTRPRDGRRIMPITVDIPSRGY